MRMTDPAVTQSLEPTPATGSFSLDRLYAFRVTYIAVVVCFLLYVFSVEAVESLLERHFSRVVAEAITVDSYFVPAADQIKTNIDSAVQDSAWVRIWDVRVNVMVLARDGITWLYVDGHAPPPSPDLSVQALLRETERLLPANGEVLLAVPHNTLLSNAILIFYASLLFQGLFFYNRRMGRKENQVLNEALELRDTAARNAESIEDELEAVRQQLLSVEPNEQEQREEIASLQAEREALEAQLSGLANRERELRGKADHAATLEQERRALEELLDEASGDLVAKDEEIQQLEKSLKRATRAAGGATGRARESDVLTKRMRTLYKNLEIDDRAIEDIIALRDENTKLRAEECLKRLSEEADNVAIRRKVGGLPNHLSIYELGFAGKRRIYYTKGQQRRFRVLVLGAKNTQQSDLDYLARLSKSDVGAL